MRASVALLAIPLLFAACRTTIESGDHYFGELPCTDCAGIKFELEFTAKNRYRSSSLFYGTEAPVTLDSGTVEFIEENLLLLRSVKGDHLTFRLNKDSLFLIDDKVTHYSNQNPEMGVLKKVASNWKPEQVPTMSPAFKASGNEPFWSLEIHAGKELILRTMDEAIPELHAKWVEPVRQTDLNAITFECQTAKGTMTVSIVRQECQDSMADLRSDYGVGISIGEDNSDPDVHFMGCGRWLGIYEVTDTWLLTDMDELRLSPQAENPLQISLAPLEGSIGGFLGCNRAFGSLQIQGDSLKTGALATTRMLCPDKMELEGRLVDILSETTFIPELRDSNLILRNASHSLVLRKMD